MAERNNLEHVSLHQKLKDKQIRKPRPHTNATNRQMKTNKEYAQQKLSSNSLCVMCIDSVEKIEKQLFTINAANNATSLRDRRVRAKNTNYYYNNIKNNRAKIVSTLGDSPERPKANSQNHRRCCASNHSQIVKPEGFKFVRKSVDTSQVHGKSTDNSYGFGDPLKDTHNVSKITTTDYSASYHTDTDFKYKK